MCTCDTNLIVPLLKGKELRSFPIILIKVLLTIAAMSSLGTLLAQLKSLFGHYFLFSSVLFRINSSSINIFLCFVLTMHIKFS